MKFTFLISSLFFSTLLSAQAKIKFEEKSFKFPKTKEGILLEHDYKFTNEGDQPLSISNIKVACTCTKFEFPKDSVQPGKSGTIHVTFDTNKKYGWQNRTLSVFSNASNNPEIIRFKVMVENEK